MPSDNPGARNFTEFFIRRPVAATVLSLMIFLLGLQAYFNLQVRQWPELTKTTIVVSTYYPGADADTIQGFVTMPLQQALAGTEGVDFMSSSSSTEHSLVSMDLMMGANADRAMTDVLTKINQVAHELPEEANDPVVTRSTGEFIAMVYLDFTSDVMSQPEIVDYLTRAVLPTLKAVPGVGRIRFHGGEPFAMRVWLDPRRMAAMGVTAADVNTALRENHFVSAAGEVKSKNARATVYAETDLTSPEAFRDIVIRSDESRLVRLRDVADVRLDRRVYDSAFFSVGERAVSLAIYPAPGANVLEVSEQLMRDVDTVFRQLPRSLEGGVVVDFTDQVRDSVDEVILSIGQAAIIVVVVVFLFLGNARAILVPIVTIPLSLVGVMILMLMLGYSFNLFTLLAMVIAIGLVVDDAIVVVENIYRHIEGGEAPIDAAVRGAREIARPVIAMTLTLAAVYAPIGFVGGLTGIFFREFAFTLAGAVLISGIVALTLAPMMASRLLKAADSNATAGLSHVVARLGTTVQDYYQRFVAGSLAHRSSVFIVAMGVVASSVLMFYTAKRELAPVEDRNSLMVHSRGPTNATLEYMVGFARNNYPSAMMLDEFSSIPESKRVSFDVIGTGTSGTPEPNISNGGFTVLPRSERERSLAEIMQEIQGRAQMLPGVSAFTFNFSNVPGAGGGPPVQFVLRTTADYRVLLEVMNELVERARASGRFLYVESDLRFDSPQYRIQIDHAKANQLGISMGDIGRTLSTLLGSNYVSHFGKEGRSYQVIPQVPRQFRFDSGWLGRYELRTASDRMVPLSTVVDISRGVKPKALTTFQQLNSATLQAGPNIGQTLGDALDYLRAEADALLPEGFSYDFQGESRRYIQEGSTLLITFVFSLVFIYLVLSAQFESWRDPLVILTAVPLSIFGAMIPITFGFTTLNIYTQVGLVTLIGLISKHGILIVEFANRLQEQEGLDRRAAVIKAASIRARPILMTTGAMAMGVLPLVLAQGIGFESRFAIGIVIFAGITIGTLFTLFVVPAVYSVMARRHHVNDTA